VNTETGARQVRVCVTLKTSGSANAAFRKVLGLLSNVKFVEAQCDADLVIFDNVRDVERGFNEQKKYVCLELIPSKKQFPANVETFQFVDAVPRLMNLVSELQANLIPADGSPEAGPAEAIPLRSDARRILVIDDTPKHIASARTGLAGHYLSVATGYEEAMQILGLGKEKFDVVLTDLHLPMSSATLSDTAFRLGELVPYGILLMVEAARQGAKFVAVVTDLNHHSDAFSAVFNHYSRFPVTIEGAKVMMMHAPMTADGSKDWARALDLLTA
jgi:CheY-like chemotaxis protein